MDNLLQSYPEDERRIGEEYLSSLTDLNCNSKPLINMLTMLAEENINYARVIVRVVEYHISQVPPEFKLPILYLIDSIIKNVKSSYVQLFGQCIVNIFLNAFESVQHSTPQVRERMYLLRQTWNEVFPASKMYALDVKVKRLDNNWPITAKPAQQPQPTKIHVNPAIHVNPEFLKAGDMEEILQAKTRELLELKKRKLELELEQTKLHLKEQERQLSQVADGIAVAPMGMPAPAPIAPVIPPAGVTPAVPTMYPGGMRHIRPVIPTATAVPGQPPAFAGIKPKVNPVNAAMLSSVRQRDPRLARQAQAPQATQQMPSSCTTRPVDPRLESRKTSSTSSSAAGHNSSRSRSKSPMRSSGSSRSNKSNSSSSNHRGSKRSESKSSTSSSGSDGRHKNSNSSNLSPTKRSSSSRDKVTSTDRYNGGSPGPSKRKSSSPASSPSKSKRNASQKSSSSSRRDGAGSRTESSSNARSRSRSPSVRDVDMRSVLTRSKSPEPKGITSSDDQPAAAATCSINAAINAIDLEKRPHPSAAPAAESSPIMDVDMRTFGSSASATLSLARPATPPPPSITLSSNRPTVSAAEEATSSSTSSSNNNITSSTTKNASGASNATNKSPSINSKLPSKVSFKIQKPFNKLEKSTAHLSTASLQATTAPSSSTSETVMAVSSAPASATELLQQSIKKLMQHGQQQIATGEKRPSELHDDDDDDDVENKLQQPQHKRSKSTKLDALFGSEDVDLRRVLPGKAASNVSSVIVVEDDSMDNWDANKTTKPNVRKATFEELRAKLAKSVRANNKNSKSDKSKDQPMSQRIKQLAEFKANDDSQEAHDESMRTILSQAQEMFENNGMNQEQYKDLVSKVVAMNEHKLKDPRRQEPSADGEEDMERNAARDAVLRKRIPKLKGNEIHSGSSPHGDDSPRYDEQQPNAESNSKQSKSKRDGKRRKPSKWGEQLDPSAAQRAAAWQLAQNNNNNNNMNKRVGAGNPAGGPNNFRAMPWQNPPLVISQNLVPPPPQPPIMAMGVVPPVVAMTKAINSLDNPMADVVRSITIDGGSKEIRFYNQVTVIFMDGDEPHEIGFQHGQRAIYIDNNEPLALSFNDDYKPFQLDGHLHRIRFGHPSRELYIDDHWYEIYFGGPAVSLPIGNKLHVLKAEGPPPNVDIGRVRRDLVVGKINMIVDAHTIVPLFLDARQQTFLLGAEQHSVQFVDSFLYALLDGQLQKLEYGGLPKGIKLSGGRNCFIRFGTLPKGVYAGQTHVRDMVYIKTEAPSEPPQPPPLVVPPPVVPPASLIPPMEAAVSNTASAAGGSNGSVPLPVAAAALGNLNIDELFQKLVSSGIIGGTNSADPTTALPSNNSSNNAPINVPGLDLPTSTSKDTPPAAAVPTPAAPPAEPIKRIDLHKPDTIKTRQTAVIATLYLGMQCSSCGVRFPPEQTIKYSQHLDWHFRQNRRERDSTRKATSRRWFYDINDWRQYEEIEDVEERERNFLEAQNQQLGPDATDDVSQQRSVDSPMPSCAAGADDVDRSCDMCHEKFEQFYNEELEEWHLRSALRVEDKLYHPLCYEDYKSSLNPPAPPAVSATEGCETNANGDVEMLNATDDNAMDTLIKQEEDGADAKMSSTVADDDDDDVIVLPNEEPSVTEIVDDEDDEYVPTAVEPTAATAVLLDATSEEQNQVQATATAVEKDQQQKADNANESDVDVEIQEPNIPFTDLDTYVEKEPIPMLNVKIKEEPKDDDYEDEDDGFEDVGTVVTLLPLPEDEISINSSETQTQTIESSASPVTIERPASVTSLSMPPNEDELELEAAAAAAASTSITEAEFNGENPQETHNLSAAGPAPALPLASLVNKIKINITKNTSSNSHNSASTTTTITTTAAAAAAATAPESSQISAISVIGSNLSEMQQQQQPQQQNAIQTISTIPVLCGGNTFVPKIATSSSSSSTNAPPANISSISVIGSSYGNSNNNNMQRVLPTPAATVTSGTSITTVVQKSITPPLATTTTTAAAVEAEPEPVIEMKAALRNVTLKKTKKVQNGVETSGLCSIM